MFTTMRTELLELVDLSADIARYDATRAAKPEISPTQASLDDRRQKEIRLLHLMDKYELSSRRN